MEDKLRAAINPQPAQTPKSAPRGVLTAAEERVRMYEEMRRKTARTKMLRNFVESAMWLMILAGLVGLFLWWKDHKTKVAAEAARIEAEAEASRLRLAEERDRLMREQREKDRMERERIQREEDNRRRVEREARERAERELRDNKERYNLYMMALRENSFDMFTKSVTNDIESVGGELCYLFPSETMPAPLYHVVYETNGMRRVSRIEANGKVEEAKPETFNKMLGEFEYLVAKGPTVYFKSSRNTPPTGILNIVKESDPAETFFSTLAPTIKALKPTYDELTFDIIFTAMNSSRKIFVENLQFGCPWSIRNVREAIEKNTPVKSTSSTGGSLRIEKFRRTVKEYGGAMIKQGVDGITYVPRHPPRRHHVSYSSTVPNCIYRSRTSVYSDNSYGRWAALHAKAQQEDADEAAYYARMRTKHADRRKSVQAAEYQRWQEEIDSTLRNGTLSYRIRKAKLQE